MSELSLRPPTPGWALATSSDGFVHALLIPEDNALSCTAQAVRNGYFRGLALIEADLTLCMIAQTDVVPPAGWRERARHVFGFQRMAILCRPGERLTLAETRQRVVRSLWQHRQFWSAGGPVSELCRKIRRCETVAELAKCLNETHEQITD